MAGTYKIEVAGDTMTVGFGTPAQNDQICRDAKVRLEELIETGSLPGGSVLKITGPASLPVAVVIAHSVIHLYEAVAVFDPKMAKFVVAVSHGGAHQVGDLID